MSESNYGQRGNEGPERETVHHHVPDGRGPYWKRAHHDWLFWVGMVVTFAAIAIYVMSDDLSLLPRGRTRHAAPGAAVSGAAAK